MKNFLQVLILAEHDPGVFQKTLNGKLKTLEDIKTLSINTGPPGSYNAIITYLEKDDKKES